MNQVERYFRNLNVIYSSCINTEKAMTKFIDNNKSAKTIINKPMMLVRPDISNPEHRGPQFDTLTLDHRATFT